MVRADAAHVKAKREAIEARLLRGQIVCVQETHWLEHEAALWEFGLLIRESHSSAAARGANGEQRLGGVATFLPVDYSIVWDDTFVLVVGHAIVTTVRSSSGDTDHIVNVYLRPEDPLGTWNTIMLALPHHIKHSNRTIYAGDFNLDLHDQTPANGVDPAATHIVADGLVIVAPHTLPAERALITEPSMVQQCPP